MYKQDVFLDMNEEFIFGKDIFYFFKTDDGVISNFTRENFDFRSRIVLKEEEFISARCEKNIIEVIDPPYIVDVEKEFAKTIDNEEITNLLNSATNDQEYFDIFHEYVADDYLNGFGDYMDKFWSFAYRIYTDFAIDFCQKNNIEYL